MRVEVESYVCVYLDTDVIVINKFVNISTFQNVIGYQDHRIVKYTFFLFDGHNIINNTFTVIHQYINFVTSVFLKK